MRSLPLLGLLLAPALLLLPPQAGAAKPQANRVRETAKPIWTLAMDGSRVAYASGGKIRVWNVGTGRASVVKGRYGDTTGSQSTSFAQVAIAGTQIAWINRNWLGNTEADEKLYSAPIAGHARLVAHAHRYDRDDPSVTGGWIAGVVGSGKVLAVSSWKTNAGAAGNERLSLITPDGLSSIAGGPGAIVAEGADGGHIAVLRSTAAWPYGTNPPLSPTPSAGIYAADGTLLGEVDLSPPDASSTGMQIALSGDRLVVLTTELYEPSGATTVILQVYDWRTGQLQETWPVAIHKYGGEVSFAVHGHLAAVEGPSVLHLVDLDTGKDVVMGSSSHTDSPPAIDSHGLVYAVNARKTRLVFVPTAELLAAVG
jgi:hypothetical protein